MEFKIIYGYLSNNAVHVHDTFSVVKYSLELLGHKVDFERYMQPGKINILLEGFTYDFLEAMKTVKKTSGSEFILIASEFVFPGGFNLLLLDKNHEKYEGSSRYWKKRYATFKQALELSIAVINFSKQEVSNYISEFSFNNIFYLPYGYLEKMISVKHNTLANKDIDILFTGSVTPYRKQILSKINEMNINLVIAPSDTPAFLRDDLIARTKLAIHMKLTSAWKYPSNSRLHYHITNSSLLLSEKIEEKSELDEFIEIASTDNFLEKCEQLISSDYIKKGIENHEKFKENMPLKQWISCMLDSTFETSML